jgi:hypothetical protein
MKQKTVRALEKDVQAAIKEALELAGCVVLDTTIKGSRGGSGTTKGIPDLLVMVPGLPCLFGLEIKRDGKAHVRTEQKAFRDGLFYGVVSTVEGALDHVKACLVALNALSDALVLCQAQGKIERVRAGLVVSK